MIYSITDMCLPAEIKIHFVSHLKVLLIGAVTSAIALALRFGIVEPESVAATCLAKGAPGWCWIRDAVIAGFSHNWFALSSLAAGLLAVVIRSRGIAVLALVLGVAGSVLYRFDLAGVGLLLGALVFARAETERYQHARRQKERERIPA